MRTPKEYVKNLNNRIITSQMLSDCLYSVNKRAKNWRDKQREYRELRLSNYYYYDKYDNEGKAREKKQEYYKQKEIMLSILKPVCIHKEPCGYETLRIYDFQKEYDKCNDDKVVYENCYYDHECDMEVWFKDVIDETKPKYNYYLFYDLGLNHTFHKPLTEQQLKRQIKKGKLKVIEIDQLNTDGFDIENLISAQFVTKLIELIKSKNFTFNKE